VDDLEVIFSGSSYGSGIYIGLGATIGSGDMAPVFDNIEYDPYYSPVHETSWGRIKSLFR
ncbi:MAG: hypothetical protein JXB46_00225, partial [Candidatus Eisenbacteria bacterium]|nr:hypothetical protein [Candidatus Eisenbacteria bacterium]